MVGAKAWQNRADSVRRSVRRSVLPEEVSDLEHGAGIRAEGSVLRELHALLKEKDPGFGGLVRVHSVSARNFWGCTSGMRVSTKG